MQVIRQLKTVGIGAFPCVVNYNYSKHKWEKRPITVRVNGKYESWADTALRSLDDPAVNWTGCRVYGIPVPRGVVIIDLDTYLPGCTTESADAILGARLQWDRAFIQTTISGGRHYAFREPNWQVRQGSDFGGGGSGVDTRVSGSGCICSGDGYTPVAPFGLLRLAYPDSLPTLPDECRPVLEAPPADLAPRVALPQGDRDLETLRDALGHVDPSTRDTWRDIGFALKHHFHDDESTGFALWDAWSRGEFWQHGCPAGYTPDTQWSQWSSFRVERHGATITVGTLYHHAMRAGWQPPARFDTSAAFGAQALPADAFGDLLTRITEYGGDGRHTAGLLEDIAQSGCNGLQALLLRNELKAVLRSSKILDRDLSSMIDNVIGSPKQTVASSTYSKNHTDNARLFLETNYSVDYLMRVDEVWYAYDGKSWIEIPDAAILHAITLAMAPTCPQIGDINGTYQVLANRMYRPGVKMNENVDSVVLFQNGALDLYTGAMLPHDPRYITTKIMPYAYTPGVIAPNWIAFVNDVFEGDQDSIALLQEWLGYMLSPTYQYQKIMLFLGPKRAGKGTIGRIMQALVGDLNYTGASLESFADDDYLDSLRGKTVAFSGDTAKTVGRHKVERVIERIKTISGGDSIDFGRKYKGRMTCVLPTRITLAANHIPKLFDDSEALSHRIIPLVFNVSFADRESPYLTELLLSEIGGIATWALQGLSRLNANKRFTIPDASRAEMEHIAETYSPMRTFIAACCTLGGKNDKIFSKDLYDAYRAWAVSEQEPHILTRKVFVTTFKDATRGRGVRFGPQRIGEQVASGFKGVEVVSVPSSTAGAFQPRVVGS